MTDIEVPGRVELKPHSFSAEEVILGKSLYETLEHYDPGGGAYIEWENLKERERDLYCFTMARVICFEGDTVGKILSVAAPQLLAACITANEAIRSVMDSDTVLWYHENSLEEAATKCKAAIAATIEGNVAGC